MVFDLPIGQGKAGCRRRRSVGLSGCPIRRKCLAYIQSAAGWPLFPAPHAMIFSHHKGIPTMDINKESLAEAVAKLKQQRDELRLKIHLGSMEAQEEWEELEKKWKDAESRLGDARETAVDVSRDVADGVKLVAKELGSAYQRIKEGLSEED
jgi:hypothetical protein